MNFFIFKLKRENKAEITLINDQSHKSASHKYVLNIYQSVFFLSFYMRIVSTKT